LAKSKLSTEEIRSLRNGGVPAFEIAELANTTKANVSFRLSPTRKRRHAKERYRRLEPTEREAYRKAERESGSRKIRPKPLYLQKKLVLSGRMRSLTIFVNGEQQRHVRRLHSTLKEHFMQLGWQV